MLYAGTSDVKLFGNGQSIVDLDAEAEHATSPCSISPSTGRARFFVAALYRDFAWSYSSEIEVGQHAPPAGSPSLSLL
jgi:hypothetical protein